MNATLILMGEHQPCDLCDHARAVMRRVIGDHPMELTVLHNDAPDATSVAAAAGAAAIRPVLIIDGYPVAYGRLSERRLRRDLSAPTTSGDFS
jgi:hypothetical protein